MTSNRTNLNGTGRRQLAVGSLALCLGWAGLAMLSTVSNSIAAADTYREAVLSEPGLTGYWTLDTGVEAAHGRLALESRPAQPVTTEGPFGGTTVDLSRGNELVLAPDPALDTGTLSIEILFQIVEAGSGNRSLLAIRDTGGVRFSLHYHANEHTLLLWNGGQVSNFRTNDQLKVGDWFHLVLNIEDHQPSVWLNGKACNPTGTVSAVRATTGRPLVIGNSVPGGTAEKADVAVAHLALYDRVLSAEQIKRHVSAAGWAHKMREQLVWQDSPVSLLESQIGYHPRNIKRAYLRSLHEEPPAGYFEPTFEVVDTGSGEVVYTGAVEPWGARWESHWWVLDFTALRTPGEYFVQTGRLVSSPFKVEDRIFSQTDLDVIALDQLEHRIHDGVDDTRRGLPGKYINAAGDDVRIYMDCGSPYSELPPVGTVVYALFEMYNLHGEHYSEADRQRMIDLAAMGADYFVAAQRHTDDPETDGMFYHSLLVNQNDTWAGDIFTYLDTAYGMALLAAAHEFFKERDPERAAAYLEASKKAWRLCTHRPYHTQADRTFPQGVNAYFWNAPHGIQDTFGRAMYNILDEDWKMPFDLRTRDRLPFIQGAALLYEITGEPAYLDSAVEFADWVMDRQFTDWENPIEGVFGTFYEFEDNTEAFFHEFMQGGFWWQGNVEALNLEGFMRLLRLEPRHPRAADWLNTIRTYAEYYARPATTVNPLALYPVALYPDPEHGGLKFFQNMLMGSSCLHGFSAKNFMMLGAFLENADYQTHAIAGVNFIAGLNPGIPNAYEDTAWDARTLIQGVGNSWFGPAHEPAPTARGSVPNGFCAAPQFWLPNFVNFIADQPDKPAGMINQGGGLQFNEGWILHSHAYVHGVALLEAPHRLTLTVLNDGQPVAAEVRVVLRESAAPHTLHRLQYETAADGTLVIDDLPAPANGRVRISIGDQVIERPVAAISAGDHALTVDFARNAELAIQVPEQLTVGERSRGVLVAANNGSGPLDLKILLSGSGVTLENSKIELVLAPGENKRIPLNFECGNKVTPYLIRALIVDGAPEQAVYSTGRIGSAR